MSYTKLHQSLITSTIWREPNHVRVAWITMLAMGDKNGEVMASIPGLADICRISIPEMEEALKCFLSPDPYSRTKAYEGRRIVEIDGGWFLINHPKYRKMASKEDALEKAAIRQANFRDRDGALPVTHGNGASPGGNAGVTQHRDIAEAEAQAEAEAEKTPQPPKGESTADFASFEVFWQRYPRKVAKKSAAKAWKAGKCELRHASILADVLARWPLGALNVDIQFVPHPTTYLNQRRWEDETPAAGKAPLKPVRAHTVDDADPYEGMPDDMRPDRNTR